MAEFFVAKEASASLGHLVHEKDCKLLEPMAEFKYLGSYASKEAALKKAGGQFHTVNYCPSCLIEKTASNSNSKAA